MDVVLYRDMVLEIVLQGQHVPKEVADLRLSLFSHAAHSTRADCLKPFPPCFYDKMTNTLRHRDLMNHIGIIPKLNDITEFTSLPELTWQLLHWIFTNPINIESVTKSEISNYIIDDLRDRTKLVDIPYLDSKCVLFKITSSYPKKAFIEGKKKFGSFFAYHGSAMENFHSIIHNGLISALNIRSAYGVGTYLSSNLNIAKQYSSVSRKLENITSKLDKFGDRFLSAEDEQFIQNVDSDIRNYIEHRVKNSVLLFPPVNNYRRFLIHKVCEQLQTLFDVVTFSVGQGPHRRTVICFQQQILSNGISHTNNKNDKHDHQYSWRSDSNSEVSTYWNRKHYKMGMEHRNASGCATKAPTRPIAAELYQPPAIRKLQHLNEPIVSTSTINASSPPHQSKSDNCYNNSPLNTTVDCNSSACYRDQSTHSAISENIKSTLTTKQRERRPDRAVYVPRPRRSQTTPPSSITTSPSETNKKPDLSKSTSLEVASTNCGTVITCDQIPNKNSSDQEVITSVTECDSNFQEANFNGLSVGIGKELSVINNCDNSENRMSALKNKKNVPLRIEDAKNLGRDAKDDRDEKELQRASKEINRSNRRIIKQTFVSDVLEIAEPTKPVVNGNQTHKVSVDPETDDWDTMFDDNGDCLDPKLLDELTASVGKVAIEKPKSDYKLYHSKQALLNAEEFPHVLEISNFPMDFKTQDLMMLFSAYKESGFDIKWVDDTHALAVFSSSKIAAEVLSVTVPFVVMKPLTEATAESRAKAKKCSSSLQPYRQRPETCAALARRLVTGALGVKLKTSPEELANERRVLREAKERKLLAAKLRDEAWES